jgi:acyl-coenzyme A thioesterase PaaI-like protein
MSIESHNKRRQEAHYEMLEHLYLSSPCNEFYDPGIRISKGEAEIMIRMQNKFLGPDGSVHPSLCFTAMSDSATFAINSMVEKTTVVTVEFASQIARPVASGELIARGRILGMSGQHYQAESVLTDGEGNELGRGHGLFVERGET